MSFMMGLRMVVMLERNVLAPAACVKQDIQRVKIMVQVCSLKVMDTEKRYSSIAVVNKAPLLRCTQVINAAYQAF